VGIAAFAVVLYSAWAGTALPTQNLAPTFVYVIFWVGFPGERSVRRRLPCFLSVACAGPRRGVERPPGRARRRAPRAAALPRPARSLAGGGDDPRLRLARAGLRQQAEPAIIGALAGAYALVQLIGMTVYGVEPWSERADGFGALFGLFARLSPFSRRGRELRPARRSAERRA